MKQLTENQKERIAQLSFVVVVGVIYFFLSFFIPSHILFILRYLSLIGLGIIAIYAMLWIYKNWDVEDAGGVDTNGKT